MAMAFLSHAVAVYFFCFGCKMKNVCDLKNSTCAFDIIPMAYNFVLLNYYRYTERLASV